MHKTICLDKNPLNSDGESTPITYRVMQVMNGSLFPGQNRGDRVLVWDCEDLSEAVKQLHEKFMIRLDVSRIQRDAFWYENYQSATSKWQTWLRCGKTSFSYDNYQVCIVTSQGGIVRL